MPTSAEFLIYTQHTTGGWGYFQASEPAVEPTAVALLAIRDEPGSESAYQKGVAWLLDNQNEDGGWGVTREDPESGWQTAWALIALGFSTPHDDPILRAVDWLTHVGTNQVSEEDFRKPQMPESDDTGALVWPWMPGQVCWIEPTAMSILALHKKNLSPIALKRMNAGIEYFRRNRAPAGGWDIGNAGPLDEIVIPRAYPTSLVLLSLAAISPEEIRPDDLSALKQDMKNDSSVLIQSSGLLAMQILGEDTGEFGSNLRAMQLPNGSWENHPFFTAWATIGLRGNL